MIVVINVFLLHHIDEPVCKGICLPNRRPIYFERFYLSEVEEIITDAKRFNTVPTHINVYRDDLDLLFSIVFGRVDNASACTILTSATIAQVSRTTEDLKKTHRLISAACYLDGNNRRCIATFCPKKQKCKGSGRRTLPRLDCEFSQNYTTYQDKLFERQERGFRVVQRKIYFDSSTLHVDVCYQKKVVVSLHDATDRSALIQTVERNEQRGLYLTDGNARLDDGRMVYSAVFTSIRYGDCDYRVEYNLDASQLYERERSLYQDGYYITTIIPTTGDLTPLFIAVFWR